MGTERAGEPRVSAHFLKLGLRALEQRGEEQQTAAHRRLTDTIAVVRESSSLSFLPVSHLLRMNEVAHQVGGAAAARAVVLDTMRLACSSPIWGRLIRTTIAAFGLSPPAVARFAPILYRLAFRGTGRMRVPRVEGGEATVIFCEVPRSCLERSHYVHALGFALEFFFVLTESKGRVDLVACDVEAGEVEYRIHVLD